MDETLPPDDGTDNARTEKGVKEQDMPFQQTGIKEEMQIQEMFLIEGRRTFMSRQEDKKEETAQKEEQTKLNETWSQDAQDELEDFIEQQGIYIRQ